MRAGYFLMALAVFGIGIASATSGELTNIETVITQFKDLFCNLVPIAIMLSVAAAAVIYAGGQMLGAEQRAKTATSWAASLMIFAIVAALVYILVPWIIRTISPDLGSRMTC